MDPAILQTVDIELFGNMGLLHTELQYRSSKIRLRLDETRISFSSTPNHFPETLPIIATALNKVFGLSPAEIVGSNPTGGMDVCLL